MAVEPIAGRDQPSKRTVRVLLSFWEREFTVCLVGDVCLGCCRARYRRPGSGFISCSSSVWYWDSLDRWHGCECPTIYTTLDLHCIRKCWVRANRALRGLGGPKAPRGLRAQGDKP